jgi:hypothetical protein
MGKKNESVYRVGSLCVPSLANVQPTGVGYAPYRVGEAVSPRNNDHCDVCWMQDEILELMREAVNRNDPAPPEPEELFTWVAVDSPDRLISFRQFENAIATLPRRILHGRNHCGIVGSRIL